MASTEQDGLSRPRSASSISSASLLSEGDELRRWQHMVDVGILEFQDSQPEKFRRRIRRGIPPSLRWEVWKAVAGFHEFTMPLNYETLCCDANKWTSQIEIDICRTFPELECFDETQQRRLMRILNAYAAYSPQIGYCQGMNFVAGLLLHVSKNEEESFVVLVRLMDHMGLSGFYRERFPRLHLYLRACDHIISESVPDLRDHFKAENVQPAVYLHEWFLTLFINCFPMTIVLIIWDVIMCEGLQVALRIAVSILEVLKENLLKMTFEEIVRYFKQFKHYDDGSGALTANRIGQLLMQHTDHVRIADDVLRLISRDDLGDDPATDPDQLWESEMNGGSTDWGSSWINYLHEATATV
eukprot:TRINITY_DN52560_c0_g1_i6.p1 TRINITY_DN52560_c0_g1~~TRINITY_DN52560_c0_g1_i6.p1  ORF type:complete len:356 (-),score=51.93 TRINITY_DN52560_c0_g1_i6:143-1210(-)